MASPMRLMSEWRMKRSRSQALVELALVMPLLVGLAAVLYQLGILFMIYLSLVHAGRDVGRWMSVHPDTTDAQFQAYVSADMPSTISAARLTAQALPGCASLTNGRCASRVTGTALQIHMSYDASASIFLPTTLSLGVLNVSVPVVLPAYYYYVMVEQR
jgi:Flp pilus assembly protein TadG